MLVQLKTPTETINFIKDQDKSIKYAQKSFQVENPLDFRSEYQTQQGDTIQQSKGHFPVINARIPTGTGLDFQKPDRYQSTYDQQDNYIKTQYLGPMQMAVYDPYEGIMERIDPVNDFSGGYTNDPNGMNTWQLEFSSDQKPQIIQESTIQGDKYQQLDTEDEAYRRRLEQQKLYQDHVKKLNYFFQ